jgi:3,4-dihydroxy 2-butanone 4-phosphate synthase/GTP cyclohydrolase II
MEFIKLNKALKTLKEGKAIILVDDDSKDSELKLTFLASKVSKELLTWANKNVNGKFHLVLTNKNFEIISSIKHNLNFDYDGNYTELEIPNSKLKDQVSKDVEIIKKAIDPKSTAKDFSFNGNLRVVPSKNGGVLKRVFMNEASVDLAKLANEAPAGIVYDMFDKAGKPLYLGKSQALIKKLKLPVLKIADLVDYRRHHEVLVKRIADAKMPTKYGDFKMVGFVNKLNGEHHVALVKGEIKASEPVLVRVHSECLTGDSFGSLRCDCGEQLQAAMKRIDQEGKGVILYMRQEGRGIGLINKIKAYALQDKGYDTVEANLALGFPDDLREYGIGAQILNQLGARKLKLMTNNPRKIKGLSGYGLKIVGREKIQMNHNEKNEYYLRTKKEKSGHILEFKEDKKKTVKKKNKSSR